jgi:hypothetical protein
MHSVVSVSALTWSISQYANTALQEQYNIEWKLQRTLNTTTFDMADTPEGADHLYMHGNLHK